MAKITAKSYKDALMVQDACNLSGVVHTFSRLISDMNDDGLDTKQICEHPISVLFADKIAHLTGTQSFSENPQGTIDKAYDACHLKTQGV